MGVKEKLLNRNKTYIMLEELKEIVESQDYLDFVQKIKALVSDGVLKPIENKNRTNGKIPSLFLKYKVLITDNKNVEFENEIKHLSSEFEISKYLSNIEIYKKHREELLVLDEFFKKDSDKLNIKISKNERAYQVWGYEKMLDTSTLRYIIKINNLEEKLNYYLTPEPFFDYIPKIKDNMTILIVENKDSWYTLRKIFMQNNSSKNDEIFGIDMLGTAIDGLLYGEGNKITKPNAIEDYEKQMLNKKTNFLYWGDLDFTGIDMFQRVKKQNEKSNIKLFTRIYEKMIDISEIQNLSKIRNKQNKNINLEDFLDNFSKEYIEKINLILSKNLYIPQEVLNYEVLGGAKCSTF